jgi:SAM-dependent methyltransferase
MTGAPAREDPTCLAEQGSVAVVIPIHNQARFLPDALQSCLAQTVSVAEIIVVDDGSSDDPQAVASEYPNVRIVRQDNAGPSTARNTGWRLVQSDFVVFLDADDRLKPTAIEGGLRCFEKNPQAWMVYGAHRIVDENGLPLSPFRFHPLGDPALESLLSGGNLIAMLGSVMFRRSRLEEVGGFDDGLRGAEDYELFLRISARGKIAVHSLPVAEYRMHGENNSNSHLFMLKSSLAVVDRAAAAANRPSAHAAAAAGRKVLKRMIGPMVFKSAAKALVREGPSGKKIATAAGAFAIAPAATIGASCSYLAKALIRHLPAPVGRLVGQRYWAPKVGRVRFGDFARTTPVGITFGYDRGTPIDRVYAEDFLAAHRQDVRGRVLEFGGNDYTRQFGAESVGRSDVLNVYGGNPDTTIIGDVSDSNVLPQAAFDCIIVTFVLEYVFDLHAAINNLHAALAPGGVLLIAAAGFSPLERGLWGDTKFWTFTPNAIRQLLLAEFEADAVTCTAKGNVFATICFLSGLGAEEVDRSLIDVEDSAYPLTVLARAVRVAR